MKKHPLRRLWFRRGHIGHMPGWVPAVVGCGLALALFWYLEGCLRQPVRALAEHRFANAVEGIVDTAVSDALAGHGGTLVTMARDGDGTVSTLTADTEALNRIRSNALEDIICQVEDLDSVALGIPLGDLTGWTLWMGRGPVLPVRVMGDASASARITSDFSDAGINQTVHRLALEVTVDTTLLLPGGQEEVSATVSVPLSETVVVGEVPNLVTGLTPAT